MLERNLSDVRIVQETTYMSHNEITPSQVGEAGCSDWATIWSVRSIPYTVSAQQTDQKGKKNNIRDQVYAHLSLGSLDGAVCFTRRHGITLGEDLGDISQLNGTLWRKCRMTLKWWIKLSILSFILALGGGTSLWSSTLNAPGVILFKHCSKTLVNA